MPFIVIVSPYKKYCKEGDLEQLPGGGGGADEFGASNQIRELGSAS